ncbi:cytidylate kinase-like family protein [Enterococcus faecium]|uniref:cytidylate kinase family protein n=1 Tax=Enterococcus TaxID=1350 RepID=UPI0009BC9D75|nr:MULTISPECIES: cytidylate kinase family protein [Enterococcus]EGP4970973.1 cytidylate kinase-like family protein [Enterococcus faecium]MBX4240832.1 cytidylate kinase-like family protein [Enterococcus lactis]MBX4248064.1 cytidylate kinase-like family protein [Enterococcus lactis]MCH6117812.1 cytidylate kinase-like family protein [Enterococcus faecium]MDQ8400749.1 cytidylate kinase family protein [Enterococcus faecium]
MKHLFIDSEYCSMGRWIVLVTAKKLGMSYYDDAKLLQSINDSELNNKVNTLTKELKVTSQTFEDIRLNEDFKTIQYAFNREIEKILMDGPSIIHERGDKKHLERKNNCLSVLIYNSSVDAKRPRVKLDELYKNGHFSDTQLEHILNQEDQARRLYKNACYNQNVWGNKEYYDLCLNTAFLSKEQCVEILVAALSEKTVDKEEFNQIVLDVFGAVEK